MTEQRRPFVIALSCRLSLGGSTARLARLVRLAALEGSVNDMMTHEPLPYLVRVRQVTDEDSPPVVSEHTITAYSLLEAMLQATINAGGSGLDDSKIKVESVEPDLAAWAKLAAERAVKAMLGSRQHR